MQAGCLHYGQQAPGPVATRPWQQTPLPLRPSTASCEAAGVFVTNGLFSPDVSAQPQVSHHAGAMCKWCQAALDVCRSRPLSYVMTCAVQVEPGSPLLATLSRSSSMMAESAATQPDTQAAELLATLQERVAALEAHSSSQQVHFAAELRPCCAELGR